MGVLGFLQNIGLTELLIFLGVLLLVFGATRIPEIARSLGKSASAFKKGLKEGQEELKRDEEEKEKESKDQ